MPVRTRHASASRRHRTTRECLAFVPLAPRRLSGTEASVCSLLPGSQPASVLQPLPAMWGLMQAHRLYPHSILQGRRASCACHLGRAQEGGGFKPCESSSDALQTQTSHSTAELRRCMCAEPPMKPAGLFCSTTSTPSQCRSLTKWPPGEHRFMKCCLNKTVLTPRWRKALLECCAQDCRAQGAVLFNVAALERSAGQVHLCWWPAGDCLGREAADCLWCIWRGGSTVFPSNNGVRACRRVLLALHGRRLSDTCEHGNGAHAMCSPHSSTPLCCAHGLQIEKIMLPYSKEDPSK